jgi:hypothetical protein
MSWLAFTLDLVLGLTLPSVGARRPRGYTIRSLDIERHAPLARELWRRTLGRLEGDLIGRCRSRILFGGRGIPELADDLMSQVVKACRIGGEAQR